MPAPERARDWLALILAPGLGARRARRLEQHFGGPLGWLEADRSALRACGLNDETISALRQPDPGRLEACLAWLEPAHHALITLDDECYPPLLRQIDDPPPALFAAGDPGLLVSPQIAIVGSRGASRGGLDHAHDFAATLARAGFVVTSGLAAGIDARAHEGCLQAGGRTVAVVGTGPDRVYPARNKALAQRIVEQGVIISPFPPGTEVRPGNFPARNRIISGASLGTLVVEAGLRSGSLITARLASEQGREVFAIPGSIHNPLARGCHALIRQGARLVETGDEIIEALAPLAAELAGTLRALLTPPTSEQLDNPATAPHVDNDPDYERLLDAIGYDPSPVDLIIQRSELTTAQVSSMLLIMELDGRVVAHPGGRYSRST
ncbi:MAG: DNA-processing protein DprA [Wenzhouxiangella sp.]|nr:DNA-processing protein DprA [Wenzhouxiangella sp.]TVR97892.1 MAG: DNA-protecting protein DprA [Wenzhouxiangellaceae bacterium]